MLLGLDRGNVLRVAVDPLRGLDLLDGLGDQTGVAWGQGLAYRGEASARDRDLDSGGLREVAQFQGMGDQALSPVAEGGSGLALPVDGLDEVAQLVRGPVDGPPGGQECLARLLQVLRVGVLDQVDQRVELVALERRPARGTGTAGTERFHDALDLAVDVSGDQLVLDALLVPRALLPGGRFRQPALAHQSSPKSS
ncbi:hypothetical protein [Streptomyces sp. NPDC092952]|uniref:hypothetical protein n=1 Tax=Streptomyces sp. NPDC092952 TaxID=3366018 RepID=UPI00381B00A9